jgi:tetratricopeptide (TPR) repeat protein
MLDKTVPRKRETMAISMNPNGATMVPDEHLDEKERALRIELGKRTVCAEARADRDYQVALDTEYARQMGDQISQLMREERLEAARKLLAQELAKSPYELRFLNLQTLVELYDRPTGDFGAAQKYARLTMEIAVEKGNTHYQQTALCHIGIAAQLEGKTQFSLMMYLAAYSIDKTYIVPIQNLAGWYSTQGQLEEAMIWIDRLILICPDWLSREDITDFFAKDEAIHNLRKHKRFIEDISHKIKR